MILLDTNIVIDMLNNEDNENWALLQQDDVVICGIVITELYRGIKSEKERRAVELFVNAVDSLPFEDNDWKPLGEFIAKLRRGGISVPVQDAMIAYLCVKFKSRIVTKDKHFELIKTGIPELITDL